MAKEFEYYKAEEELTNRILSLQAVIELKQGLISMLETSQGSEYVKLAKRYVKDIQKGEESLLLAKNELKNLQEANIEAEPKEKKEELPAEILKMSDDAVAGIDEYNKNNENLIKMKAQIKELSREIIRLQKLSPEVVQEISEFIAQLIALQTTLSSDAERLEKIVDELNLKSLKEVHELIDIIRRYEKGYWKPAQMQ